MTCIGFLAILIFGGNTSGEAHKCYERTLLPDTWYQYLDEGKYPVYNGPDIASDYLDTVYLFRSYYHQKQYRDKMETLQSQPKYLKDQINMEEYAERVVLVNHLEKINEYAYEDLEEELILEPPRTKVLEVLCSDQLDNNVRRKLLKRLTDHGYHLESEQLDDEKYFKAVMTRFQKDHNLPIGNLNIITLNYLEIDIE